MSRTAIRALMGAASAFVLLTAAPAANPPPIVDPQATELPAIDADMQAVLDKLKSLNGKPIESLTPDDARNQPTPADAVMAIMDEKNIPADDGSVETDNVSYTAADGSTSIDARIYKPAGAQGPLPVVLYIHGGGWVIADLDVYDATPRALAKMANAMVVSVHYRQAPENKFPAAHDDVRSAYQWLTDKADDFGGDPTRIAIVGESAGGNMAIDTAIGARDMGWTQPRHVIAVYPVAATTAKTDAKARYVAAQPLNTPMLDWFFNQTLASPDQAADPRLDLVNAKLDGLPPTTIILAEIDPLHDDGTMLAEKLKAAGVTVDVKDYPGVTHEFFGMGAVVADAKDAEMYAADKLKAALSATEPAN